MGLSVVVTMARTELSGYCAGYVTALEYNYGKLVGESIEFKNDKNLEIIFKEMSEQ